MKYANIKSGGFTAIEFWLAISAFVFALIIFISPAFDVSPELAFAPNRMLFEEGNVSFNYYQNYLIPLLIRYCCIFAAFTFINFQLVPALLRGEQVRANIIWTVLSVIALFLVVLVTNTYHKQYLFYTSPTREWAFNSLWQMSFVYTFRILLIYAAYLLVKLAGFHVFGFMSRWQLKSKYLTREVLIGFPLWIIISIFLLSVHARELFCLWLAFIPTTMVHYLFAFNYSIPVSLGKKRSILAFVLREAPFCFLSFLFWGTLLTIAFDDDDAFAPSAVNGLIQFLVVAPALWLLFKRRMKGSEELYALKKELGRSAANLDFLRSQINPHFLFNALNTIYGTAIQENAERTGEAVQKLGDMMRFMLQENVQEKISLVREIDYLNNYIGLQQLRTESSPAIRIQVDVPEEITPPVQIAPMLLIPFVENAFKHGISLREESYIKVSLELKDSVLYFDVFNSKHPRPQFDPERDSNGIGLVNVKQRLQLLYPNKHELVIRETNKDFFVHLIVNLGK